MTPAGTVRVSRLTARAVQIALGCLWLLDGALQLQPRLFGPAFAHDVILPSAAGQPAVLSGAITHLAGLIAVQPALVNALFAGVQLLIGIGLLMKQTVRPALVVSTAWALGVWVVGEGMGGLLAGTALPLTGAPGAALLYAVLAVLVWPASPERSAQAGIGRGPDGSPAAEGPLGAWAGRVAWSAYWTGMGILWLLPSGRASGAVTGAVGGAASGEPGWFGHLETAAAHALPATGSGLAVTAAVLSLVVGLGPMIFRRYGPFLVVGTAISLVCWVFGQALGQMLTGMGTDPSTGPLVVLLALAICPSVEVVRGSDRHRSGAAPVPTGAPLAGLGDRAGDRGALIPTRASRSGDHARSAGRVMSGAGY
jgi:hypothetical protein